MKQAKTFLVSTLLTLLAFGAVIYSSCTKDATCANSCLNGGICSNKTCICPTGFTGDNCGDPVTASITYTNDTYTPVIINANGVIDTIPVAGSISYNGLYGNPLNVVASTYGVVAGKIVGSVITWNVSKVFPSTGAANYGLDVDSTYFFLKLVDNSTTYPAFDVLVNYGSPIQTDDTVNVSNDRNTHDIGYYKISKTTELYVHASPVSSGVAWHKSPFGSTIFTQNQSYTYSFP